MNSQTTGFTVWLTGMSGAGKSTLAQYIASRFRALGKSCEVLEGSEVEQLFSKGLQETKDDRNLLVKRLGYVAKNISRADGVALVPALSPYRDARDQIRREIGRFVEVFVDCPVETLLRRDNTGRYKKAINGEIPNFVGITDPYEPPSNPEVMIRSDQQPVADAAQRILQALLDLGYLKAEEVKLMAGKRLAKGDAKKRAKAEAKAAAQAAKTAAAKEAVAAAKAKAASKAKPGKATAGKAVAKAGVTAKARAPLKAKGVVKARPTAQAAQPANKTAKAKTSKKSR